MGGPLIAVPESSVDTWGGCTEDGSVLGDADGRDDYDRACEVQDWAGVIAVGGGATTVLVLADEPAMTCFLPEKRLFVRWLAADSEAELFAAADAALADPDTTWEDSGLWVTDGPAVLMDSAEAGADLGVDYPDGASRKRLPCSFQRADGGSAQSTRRTSSRGQVWCNLSPRLVRSEDQCPCCSNFDDMRSRFDVTGHSPVPPNLDRSQKTLTGPSSVPSFSAAGKGSPVAPGRWPIRALLSALAG
ncbi:Imm21 family immunity protein [Streptomyces sp. NPDC006906]